MAGWLIKNLFEKLLLSSRRNLLATVKGCFQHGKYGVAGVKKAFEFRHVSNGFLLVTISAASPALPQVFSTQQQALERAFPKPQVVERQTLFLDDKQVESIQKLARAKLESKIVTYYLGKDGDKITSYAFFATDIVRTKAATHMAVVNPDSTVRLVEILAFYEPMDYFSMPRWLDLFRGKLLNDNLWPRRDIHNITGATLTTQAITQGVRLEVTHSHLPMMAMVMLVLTHLLIFASFQHRTKIVFIAVAFLSTFLHEAGGWLVRFVHPGFAWLKVTTFIVMQGMLAFLMGALFMFLVLGQRGAGNGRVKNQAMDEPAGMKLG